MTAATVAPVPPAAAPAPTERRRAAFERSSVDNSCRVPVLAFFASSVVWLLVGTVLALVASTKLHWPDFLGSVGWLTFGRVRSAHLNVVAYGWGSMVGIGVLLWLMARLARAELRYPRVLLAAVVLWNLGVLIGAVSILAGRGTSVEWLEFPGYVPPFFITAFGLIAVWALLTFRSRREPHVYVSQWYLFGAVFWFPWLYTSANLLLFYAPVSGVVQGMVNWWYGHNTIGLWFATIGLASAYYLIPKVIGRPIYSYYLSIIGFWSLALFYNWAGVHHLVGGPLPAWLITLGIVGSMMMLIPVGAVALNHHMTMVGNFSALRYSPTLRFVVFGSMTYTAVSVQGSFEALRWASERAHFTHYTVGHAHLGMYGFFTMIMFGSMYYIVPRLTGWEWGSANLIRAHFWCTALGIVIYFVALTWGGWWQGVRMNDPATYPDFVKDVVQFTLPYLKARTFAGVLIFVGHIAFAVLFVMNLFHLGRRGVGPTLLAEHLEELPPAPQPATASS